VTEGTEYTFGGRTICVGSDTSGADDRRRPVSIKTEELEAAHVLALAFELVARGEWVVLSNQGRPVAVLIAPDGVGQMDEVGRSTTARS
jgi:hypothetical protein